MQINLFDIIVNLRSKLYYKVLLKSGNYIVNLLKLTLVFRTWIVRFGHPVWMSKLTDIITSLDSVIHTKSPGKYNLSLEPVNKQKDCVCKYLSGSKEIKRLSKSKSRDFSYSLEVLSMQEDEIRNSWTYDTKPKISTSSLSYIHYGTTSNWCKLLLLGLF